METETIYSSLLKSRQSLLHKTLPPLPHPSVSAFNLCPLASLVVTIGPHSFFETQLMLVEDATSPLASTSTLKRAGAVVQAPRIALVFAEAPEAPILLPSTYTFEVVAQAVLVSFFVSSTESRKGKAKAGKQEEDEEDVEIEETMIPFSITFEGPSEAVKAALCSKRHKDPTMEDWWQNSIHAVPPRTFITRTFTPPPELPPSPVYDPDEIIPLNPAKRQVEAVTRIKPSGPKKGKSRKSKSGKKTTRRSSTGARKSKLDLGADSPPAEDAFEDGPTMGRAKRTIVSTARAIAAAELDAESDGDQE